MKATKQPATPTNEAASFASPEASSNEPRGTERWALRSVSQHLDIRESTPMLSWRITNGASILTVSFLGFWLIVGSALAQEGASDRPKQGTSGAQELVIEATRVVDKMKSDPQLLDLMKKAKGLYVVPEFGRGAIIVGGRGGAGLVVVRQDGKWSDPAFYDFGAISIGPQIGGSGGSAAFLLMDQNAVDAFKSGNKFALNAEAGLTIVTYSGGAQASWGKGDIIFWTNTKGAYAGATASVSDVNWDDGNNKAYYGDHPDMSKILSGAVSNPAAAPLKEALPR